MGNKCNKSVPPPVERRESDRRGFRTGLVRKRSEHNVWEDYQRMEVLGSGMTGKVYLVKHKGTGHKYALKYMSLRSLRSDLLEDLRNEIELLRMLDHPNVIKLRDWYEDTMNIYLVLEYCSGGELFDRLHEQAESHYTEREAAALTLKMCAAIAYCHVKEISHRDLKLENFIFETMAVDSNLKLIDFGLSRKYGNIGRMKTMVGTPYYIAPEVLKGQGYSQACDLWSIGVIAYMLLCGSPPFHGKSDHIILEKVKRGNFSFSSRRWTGVSEDAKSFIRALLVTNPKKRLTAEQALAHPWLFKAHAREAAAPLGAAIVGALGRFPYHSMFKRTILEAIAFSIPSDEVADLRRAFIKMDRDQTGFVRQEEMVDVLMAEGISREEAKKVFVGVDQDGMNMVSYTEFLAAALDKKFYRVESHIREAFDRLDIEGLGRITAKNLKSILGDDYTSERVEKMMQEADLKGNGVIDYDEFKSVLRGKVAGGPEIPLSDAESDDEAYVTVGGGGGGSGLSADALMTAVTEVDDEMKTPVVKSGKDPETPATSAPLLGSSARVASVPIESVTSDDPSYMHARAAEVAVLVDEEGRRLAAASEEPAAAATEPTADEPAADEPAAGASDAAGGAETADAPVGAETADAADAAAADEPAAEAADAADEPAAEAEPSVDDA